MNNNLKRILVVDDNDEIRYMVSKILSRMGYEVLSANSGTNGLNLFMKNQFDLVITDFDMPGIDGWNLAFHIKENSPSTLVILMTGADKNDFPDAFSQSPVDQLLFKPFGYGEIEETIQKTMNLHV